MSSARQGHTARGVVFTALAILIVAVFGLFGGFGTGPSAEARSDQPVGPVLAGENGPLPILLDGCAEPDPLLIGLGLDPRQWFCVTETITYTLQSTGTTTTSTSTLTVTVELTEFETTTEAPTTFVTTETASAVTTSTLVETLTAETTTTATIEETSTIATSTTTSLTKTKTETIRCLFFFCDFDEPNGTVTGTITVVSDDE